MTNRYGYPMEIGKIYSVKGPISFGNYGNGFHYCKNLVDVFRFGNTEKPNDFIVTKVVGYGDTQVVDDEYYGYYDMYVSRNLYIVKLLSREEIISQILTSPEPDVLKFLSTFTLTPEEIVMFKQHFASNNRIISAIKYYQEKQEDTYIKIYQKNKE